MASLPLWMWERSSRSSCGRTTHTFLKPSQLLNRFSIKLEYSYTVVDLTLLFVEDVFKHTYTCRLDDLGIVRTHMLAGYSFPQIGDTIPVLFAASNVLWTTSLLLHTFLPYLVSCSIPSSTPCIDMIFVAVLVHVRLNSPSPSTAVEKHHWRVFTKYTSGDGFHGAGGRKLFI